MRQTNSESQSFSYPFPPEATSICIDIEPDQMDDEPPFTSEFNISDYFVNDNLTEFELAFGNNNKTESLDTKKWQKDELGCSRFFILPEVENLFSSSIQSQFTDNAYNVHMTGCSSTSPLCINNQLTSNLSTSSQYPSAEIEIQSNKQTKHQSQLLNESNIASVLSKSLTSPTHRSSDTGNVHSLSATGTSSSITNVGNGHLNSPVGLAHHLKHLPNSAHLMNSQSTIFLPQKHSPSNQIPSYNKFSSLARQQQHMQNQVQQIQKSGEIVLHNSR